MDLYTHINTLAIKKEAVNLKNGEGYVGRLRRKGKEKMLIINSKIKDKKGGKKQNILG